MGLKKQKSGYIHLLSHFYFFHIRACTSKTFRYFRCQSCNSAFDNALQYRKPPRGIFGAPKMVFGVGLYLAGDGRAMARLKHGGIT
jgi:hypothetical protein